jgi:hypothetical protein
MRMAMNSSVDRLRLRLASALPSELNEPPVYVYFTITIINNHHNQIKSINYQ